MAGIRSRQGAYCFFGIIATYPSVAQPEALRYQNRVQRFILVLDSLSATERTLLWGYYERNMQELANSYGLTRATVHRRLGRIQLKLEKAYRTQSSAYRERIWAEKPISCLSGD